jgi:hypothetical protein
MGFIITITGGLVIWIVLWAIGVKGLDAFLLATAIILAGATVRLASGYLPGRRS